MHNLCVQIIDSWNGKLENLTPKGSQRGSLVGRWGVAMLACVSSGTEIAGLYIACVSKASGQTHIADLI